MNFAEKFCAKNQIQPEDFEGDRASAYVAASRAFNSESTES